MTAPLVPLMPLGRSTARTGAPLALIASIISQRLAVHRPVEAGAEQRIDDQRGLADRLRIEWQHRILPTLRRGGRIALQAVALAQQDHRDLTAARRQLSRRHKTVAAIVAGPGHDQDRPLLDQLHCGLRHRLAGAQHQREARRARGNGEPIGTLHFSCGQNFHANSLVQNALF